MERRTANATTFVEREVVKGGHRYGAEGVRHEIESIWPNKAFRRISTCREPLFPRTDGPMGGSTSYRRLAVS
jgi:hypothetical protein